MALRRGTFVVLCGAVLLSGFWLLRARALPASEQGLESTVSFPVTLEGVRQLDGQGKRVVIEKDRLTEPCPPHAICLFNRGGRDIITADVWDRASGAQVAQLWFDAQGRLEWGRLHDGQFLREVQALRPTYIPRKVVVETRRRPAPSLDSWFDAWAEKEGWEPVSLLSQVDLLPDYHRAWEAEASARRADLGVELLRLYGEDAVPFLRTHLATPAQAESLDTRLLEAICEGWVDLPPRARAELVALFARNPASEVGRKARECMPESPESPTPASPE